MKLDFNIWVSTIMFTKIFFMFFCFLIFSEDSLGLQSVVRRGSEMLLSQSSRSAYRGFHLPKMFFSDISITKQNPVSEESKNIQVFACPIHDSISQHIISHDESIRVDILKAFTGIQSLSSATRIDELHNPYDPILKLRKLINSIESQDFFERIKKSSTIDISLDGKKIDHAFEFLKGLVVSYEDFSHAFPYHRSHSVSDFLCETDSGYVTIELQVSAQDYWDRRVLAYLSSIYGNQMTKDYKQIQDIIGTYLSGIYRDQRMDILNFNGSSSGGDTLNTESWNVQRFIRNYIFIDQNVSGKKIPVLRFIHYSLNDVNLEEHEYLDKNPRLKQWVEFFKSAHEKESIPSSIDEPLRKAYEMIRVDALKEKHPDLLKDKSEHPFFLFIIKHEVSK